MTEQNKPLFIEEDIEVTKDLAKKIGHDVFDLINRILELAPPTKLPIILGAGASAIAYLACYLESNAGIENTKDPDKRSILLSALLVAYTMIHGGEHDKIIVSAMNATDLLIKEGMI